MATVTTAAQMVITPQVPDTFVTFSVSAGSMYVGWGEDVGSSSPNSTLVTSSYTVSLPRGTPLWAVGSGGSATYTTTITPQQSSLNSDVTSAGTPAFILESSGSYAQRATATSNSTRTVIWIGIDPPTIGAGFAINDVDIWIPTSV